VYEPKPLNEISTVRKNTGDIDMNDKRITNMSTLPDLTVDGIMGTPKHAVNVQSMTSYVTASTTASLLLNTAYCGPLSGNMNCKGKVLTNLGDTVALVENDPDAANKIKQAVTVGYMNQHCLIDVPDDRTNFYANDYKIYELGDANLYQDVDVRTLPD
jgi:hypothetical protein